MDGTKMVWKNEDVVYKVLMEFQAETAVIVVAFLNGVSDCIVPPLGFNEESHESVDDCLRSPAGMPDAITLSSAPLTKLSYELALPSGSVWVTIMVNLTAPLTVKMPYLGQDLEQQTRAKQLLRHPLELAMQTVEMTSHLCKAGLWPSDIRLSNLALREDRVVLLDYRSMWHSALSVPAISSVVVQSMYYRTYIAADSALFSAISAFSDLTIRQEPNHFLSVEIAKAVAVATKMCIAELLGFSDAWLVFSERIDTDIAALDSPSVQLCVVNDPNDLVAFRSTYNKRTQFIVD